jgi:TonB family protein
LTRIWIAGVVAGVGLLILGLGRLRRLAAGAAPVTSGAWADRASEIAREFGLPQPLLLQSRHPAMLVTWGVRRPKILLPATAPTWRDDRIRIVLCHELAHACRGDWVVTLAAELLRAVYWFNPLVWIACRRLRQESEQACDDAVLNRGVEGSEYATQLVEIARELQQRRIWVPAPSVARPSTLERRVRAMLDTHVNRRPLSRFACVTTLLGLLAVTIPVTAVAVDQVFGTVGGSIVDPMNGALPGVTLVLTNRQNQAKYEVKSDRTGRYEFVGLAPGDYLLEAKLPGFAVLRGALTVTGQSVQQDLKLEIGTLEETINVRARPGGTATAVTRSNSGRPVARRPAPVCSGGASTDGTPIGGNLRPPAKLLDVRPLYPASAVASGIEGVVTLQSRIGTDGSVEEVNVVSSPNADLSAAAMDAVRQWIFDSTYLNCVAVPVTMKVTVSFGLER